MDVRIQQLLGTNKSSSSSYLLSSCCCCNNNRIRNDLLLNNNFIMLPPRFNQRRRIIISINSRIRRRNSNFCLYSSSSSDANNQPEDEDDSDSFKRLYNYLGDSLKKETGGFDLDDANAKLSAFRSSLSQFITWNHFTKWKDITNWDPTRVGVFAIYAFVTLLSLQRIYIAVRAPFLNRQATQVSQAYMDALIPDPTPANIRKYKKGLWRKSMPKGLKMKKFIEGPEGTLIHDTSYVGEDAWDDEDDDDATVSKNKVKEIIDRDGRLNTENKSKLQEELGLSDVNQENGRTWQERLQIWKDVLKKEVLAEKLDSSRAKYAIEFDMKEVEKSFREDAKVKREGPRALWISKRWWRYRPKLPYTYFLEKIECSEMAAVVFTEDLKTFYVTMNMLICRLIHTCLK